MNLTNPSAPPMNAVYPNIKDVQDSQESETLKTLKNWRITKAILLAEYLKREKEKHKSLAKRYDKIKFALSLGDVGLTSIEVTLAGVGIAFAPLLPFAGLFFGCSLLTKFVKNRVNKKFEKHYECFVVSATKLNSYEKIYSKAIEDEVISQEEFEILQKEVELYDEFMLKQQKETVQNGQIVIGEEDKEKIKQLQDLLSTIKVYANK